MSDELARLVDLGDLDELTREVDRRCQQRDWDNLVLLHKLCEAALDRGKQLWPIAAHIEYRLALEAPGPWAAQVLVSSSGHFSLGPLSEVAAQNHTWSELAPFVDGGPVSGMAAHERVIRGEDLTEDPVATAVGGVLELPLRVEPWEPAYPLAVYTADSVSAPPPAAPVLQPAVLPAPGHMVDDPEPVRALLDVVRVWTTESNGRAEAIAVGGAAGEALELASGAVAALGVPRWRVAAVSAEQAMAWLAWAGASGGAHGRRRGMAAGRFAAWWAVAALAGLLDHWPVSTDELGVAAGELQWFLWDAGEPETGWALRLAVADPAEGLAWALAAIDQRSDPPA